MTNSRAQPLPTNLKERIAALEQRNSTSSAQRATSSASSTTGATNASALRDKIAKFERKGGVPVPRGSFGLGAPPLAENGQGKKRGELYGNRIPRLASGGPPMNRSSSPLSFVQPSSNGHRSVSLSALDMDDIGDMTPPDPSPLLRSPSPNSGLPLTAHTAVTLPPRATDFATALDMARKVESAREASLSPSPTLSKIPLPSLAAVDDEVYDSPPAIVVFSSEEPVDADTVDISVELEPGLPSADTTSEYEPLEENNSSSDLAPSLLSEEDLGDGTIHIPPSTTDADVGPSTSAVVINDEGVTSAKLDDLAHDSSSMETITPHNIGHSTPDIAEVVEATSQATGSQEAAQHDAITQINEPIFAHTVSPPDTTEVEAETQSLSSDYSNDDETPLLPDMSVGDVMADHFGDESTHEDNDDKEASLVIPSSPSPSMPESPLARLAYDVPESPNSSSEPKQFLPVSKEEDPIPDTAQTLTAPSRPTSIEASPSHVSVAHRVSPSISRGVPMFIPATQDRPVSELISTPEHHETEFGTVSVRRGSESSSFSAVVHRKSRDTAPSSSSTDAHPRLPPVTPQVSKVKQESFLADTPPSPGFGDLAALLEEAAMLESRLLSGDLPSEERKRAAAAAEEEEMAKAEQAKAEKEERRKGVVPVPSLRQEEPVIKAKTKSKGLRSKAFSFQRTEPSPVEPKNDRLMPNPPQSTQVFTDRQPTTEPSKVETIESAPSGAAENPPPPPPKSPRPKYFSGLRRLASSSRSSYTMPGSYPRHSISTSSELSSEDSMPVVTPSDHGLGFAGSESGSISEFGQTSGVAWPALSPKKSGGSIRSISRASSFAEKMFGRGRTKSTVSTMSSVSINEPSDRMGAGSMESSYRHSMVPSIVIPEIDALNMESLEEEQPRIIVPPMRSTSLYQPQTPPSFSPTNPNAPFLPVPHSFEHANQPETPPSGRNTRPASRVSMSSAASSAPSNGFDSPLLDKALFDAFPSVPKVTPVPRISGTYPRQHASRPSLALPKFEALSLSDDFGSSGSPFEVPPEFYTSPAPLNLNGKSTSRGSTEARRI